MQNPGEVSADGKWRWDGKQWMPNPAAVAMSLPPVQPGLVATPRTNPLAIVALVSAILSWVLLPVAGALVAVVAGHIARGQIRRSDETGSGMALAALVIGYVHLVVVVILAVVWVGLMGEFFFAFFGGARH